MNDKKGFTLIEVLGVIALLAVIILISTPTIINLYNNAKNKLFIAEANTVYKSAANQILTDRMNRKITKTSVYYNGLNTYDLLGEKLNESKDANYCITLTDDYKINEFKFFSNGKYISLGENASSINVDEIEQKNKNDVFECKSECDCSVVSALWSDDCTNSSTNLGCKMVNISAENPTSKKYGVYKSKENGTDIYYYKGGDHCENSSGVIQSQTTENECINAGYTWKTLNNNIIYNNICWQIIRTNSDGSIRMIYNGNPINNQCTATGEDTQIGKSSYNSSTFQFETNGTKHAIRTDAAAVGYMFGSPQDKNYKVNELNVTSAYITIGKGFYVSKSYKYNSETKRIELENPVKLTSERPPQAGDYTCKSTAKTCYYAWKIPATDLASITYNADDDYWEISKTYRIGLYWTDSIEEATKNDLDSTIKTVIDAWYINNPTLKSDDLKDSGYCNDRTTTDESGFGNKGSYSAQQRLNNKTPSLECLKRDLFTVSNESGNKYLSNPIGLITLDEILLAEDSSTSAKINSYLYTGQTYWTMTPYIYSPTSSYAYAVYYTIKGTVSGAVVSDSYGIRPVISLKKDTNINAGDGSKSNPFIIVNE